MSRLARTPTIDNWVASADPIHVVLPKATARYMLRIREPVDATVALWEQPAKLWTLKAAETYSEENLCLDVPLELAVNVAAGSTLEVWRWDA